MKKYVICNNDASWFIGDYYDTYEEAQTALRLALKYHGLDYVKNMQIMTRDEAVKREKEANA